MAKSEEQELINYRYALAFHKLITSNKKKAKANKKKGLNDFPLDDSYGKLSSSTGLRPATISNIISGLSDLKASTIYLLLSALNKTYKQFGTVMDTLSDEEVNQYKRVKEKERSLRSK